MNELTVVCCLLPTFLQHFSLRVSLSAKISKRDYGDKGKTKTSWEYSEKEKKKEKGESGDHSIDLQNGEIKKMSLNHCIHFLLFFLFTAWAASSSSFISYNVFRSQWITGRTLLQAKSKCSENFENKNYTIITSKCKGPQYPSDKCCEALKEFACPFVDKINDQKTDCADTMFSYINLYGKFPPGLFANKCREGKEGLDCQALPPPKPSHAAATHSTLLMLTTGFLLLFLLMF